MADKAYAPVGETVEAARSAPTLSPVYLVNNGGTYEISTTGPADAYWVLGANGYEIDTTATAHDAAFFMLGTTAYVR